MSIAGRKGSLDRRISGALMAPVLLAACQSEDSTDGRGGEPLAWQEGDLPTSGRGSNETQASLDAREGRRGVPDVSESYSPAALDWQPCLIDADLDCGTLTLPVDYRDPSDQSFELAVIRARASGPGDPLGVLFTHPGIHASGVEFLSGAAKVAAFQRIRARFDIVSLDPRGAGSTRRLDCQLDLPDLPPTRQEAELVEYFDEYGERVAEQCLDEDAAFVRSITANNFARDIDVFRRALGERQLSFAVLSNTGPVAATYASLFPEHVRAMLLDSTVAPEHYDYIIERWQEQVASRAVALQRVDRLCGQDTSCPLHDRGVVVAFDTLKQNLLEQPGMTPDGRQFSAADLADAISNLLAVEQSWPMIAVALSQGLDGQLATLSQFQTGPSQAGDAIIARSCNDYGTRQHARDFLPQIEALSAAHPRLTDPVSLGRFPASCTYWPEADVPVLRDVSKRLDLPILLLAAELDSEAPLSWTRRMARALGMDPYVVRYQGGGHGLIQRSDVPCITDLIDAYLFEGRLPDPNYSCP